MSSCESWSSMMVSVHSMVTCYWKQTLSSIASGYIDMAPPSNSSKSMHMVVLSATRPTTYWCIVYVLISKYELETMCVNLSKYMFNFRGTYFLSSPQWVCWMGGITCMCTMTCMFLNSLSCDQQNFSTCLLRASCWDGSITHMGTVSLFCACCTPCCTYSCYKSFSHMCSSYSSLSCYFNTCNSFSIPFSSLAPLSCCVVTS